MDYVTAYPENIRKLVDLGLTPREFRVLFYVLEVMGWGNLFSFSQRVACDALGIDKSTMSKIFAALTRRGVLVKIEGHHFINSNLFAKGLSGSMYPETRKRLDAAAVVTDVISAARTVAEAEPQAAQAPAPVAVAPAAHKPRQASAHPAVASTPRWQVTAITQARAQRARVPL